MEGRERVGEVEFLKMFFVVGESTDLVVAVERKKKKKKLLRRLSKEIEGLSKTGNGTLMKWKQLLKKQQRTASEEEQALDIEEIYDVSSVCE